MVDIPDSRQRKKLAPPRTGRYATPTLLLGTSPLLINMFTLRVFHQLAGDSKLPERQDLNTRLKATRPRTAFVQSNIVVGIAMQAVSEAVLTHSLPLHPSTVIPTSFC